MMENCTYILTQYLLFNCHWPLFNFVNVKEVKRLMIQTINAADITCSLIGVL